MKTHIVENGIVTNTILATVTEAQSAFPGAVCIDGAIGGIGWAWDGETLTPPPPAPPVVPSAVTMRQARLALLGAGLLDDVDAAINALPSPQKEAARIEWEYAQEVQRHNGFVSVLAPMLGMTAEQTDNLFIVAAQL